MTQQALGTCPVCSGSMRITEYNCTKCGVSIRGDFEQSEIGNLPQDQMHFVRVFLKCEGNFREVERELGISYPTVKSRLAKINGSLGLGAVAPEGQVDRLQLLKEFRDGKVSRNDLLQNL